MGMLLGLCWQCHLRCCHGSYSIARDKGGIENNYLIIKIILSLKGKSLPEVSQHFYVCCSLNTTEDISENDDFTEVLTPSKKTSSVLSRILNGTKDHDIAGKCRKFTSSERHLNHTETKDLLQQQEKLLRRKSAPIVKIEELENML